MPAPPPTSRLPRRPRPPPTVACAASLLLVGALLQGPSLRAEGVQWELVGNASVPASELRIVLGGIEEELSDPDPAEGLLEDAAYEVVRYYESVGFLRAGARCLPGSEKGKRIVRVEITEGPRSEVVSMVFTGQSRFTSEELGQCFEWTRTGLLGGGARVFTHAALDSGIECIVARYQLEGRLFAIAVPSISMDAEGKVSLRVEIEEGPLMRLELPVRLEGTVAFSSQEILSQITIEQDPTSSTTLYVPRLPLFIKGKILDYYRNRGYLSATVDEEREVDLPAQRVRLRYQVIEGPLTAIEGIDIHGNRRTWEWVVLGRMKLSPGDLYSDEALRESHKSLLRAGLFSKVAIEVKPVPGKEGLARLDVQLEERARFSGGFFAGWGSYELLRGGLRLTDRNLFGTGHRLSGDIWGSFRGEGVRVEYINPYVFTDSLAHNVLAQIERREHPSFEEFSRTAETGLRYRYSNETFFGLAYRLRDSRTRNEDTNVPPELLSDVLLSSVLLSAVYDNRNSFVDPTSGFTLRATVEDSAKAIGSDLDFVRVTGFLSQIAALPWGLHLVTAARAGAIFRTGDRGEEIPIQERFFNGGEYTIRSFQQDEAGPTVEGDPIGGEAFTTFNLELRVPFPIALLEGLQLALFFDAGTLVTRVEEFGGGRYFYGIGSGIRYNTPVGPLRLDAAYNPDRADGEDSFVVHFGLGYPF